MTNAAPLPTGAHRFTSQEPTADFVWLFRNTDGTFDEYPTEMTDYTRFKALYGVPEGTCWRPTQSTSTPTEDK